MALFGSGDSDGGILETLREGTMLSATDEDADRRVIYAPPWYDFDGGGSYGVTVLSVETPEPDEEEVE